MSPTPRARRSDGAANRAAIVAAAARLWVLAGESVPLDAVAREAGVGIGTLYRHFRDRADLLDAVVDASYELVADLAASAGRQGGSALAAVGWFFDRLVAESPRLALPLLGVPAAEDGAGPRRGYEQRIASALTELLARGISAGEIRPDAEATDLIVSGAALASIRLPGDVEGRSVQRLRAVLLDGLRPTGRTESLPAALSRDELTRALPHRSAATPAPEWS